MGAVKHNILVVDDEQGILSAIERLLRRDGYDILLAENGSAALERLTNTEVAVIICDQRMPGMAGDEVLARAAVIRPDAFRITLTGYADLKDAQSLINKAGINRFVVKPWDDSDLRAIVQEGVKWYELRRENLRLQEVTREQNLKLAAWNKELEQQVHQRTQELQQQNQTLRSMEERLKRSLHDTVSAIAGLLEAISPTLGIHCRRVARLAGEVGRRLNVSVDELRDIEFAALLHDIGKTSHLHQAKTAAKSKDSRGGTGQVRHPESGAAILSHVDGFDRIALAVRQQQEHYDGSGLPNGLTGQQISLAARIIAAANTYDKAAFQNQDPAHPSQDAGGSVLTRYEGTRFDPMIVRTLLGCVNAAFTNDAGEIESQLSPRQLRPGMVLTRPVYSLNGVLLLKESTVLTELFITHILDLSDVDPLLTEIYVRCQAQAVPPAAPPELRATVNEPPAAPLSPPVLPAALPPPGTPGNAPNQFSPEPAPQPTPRAESPSEGPKQADDHPARGPAPVVRASSASDSVHPDAKSPSPRKLVLIVDDTMSICNSLQRELRRAGYDTLCANSGVDALHLLENHAPDVTLTDIAMPGMSGEQLVGHLQQCAPAMPCVIITGFATRDLVRKLAKEPNVAGFLVKPWDQQRLTEAIEAALAKTSVEPLVEKIKKNRVAEPA
jgi:response regulator RpfG family c-di-GMP phosphodiesterase